MRLRSSASLEKAALVFFRIPLLSTKIFWDPFTMISETLGSRKKASSGPADFGQSVGEKKLLCSEFVTH
jgi:hypothetical protein